jgi:hypothetical protein
MCNVHQDNAILYGARGRVHDKVRGEGIPFQYDILKIEQYYTRLSYYCRYVCFYYITKHR